MARKPRIHFAGALYHVILRGNDRQDIFFQPSDRRLWETILKASMERYQSSIHCFCWMTNHLHMVIQVDEKPLAATIRYAASQYSRKINLFQRRSGHLFERRHRAILVREDAYLKGLVRYIHHNPVRAGMVAKPGEYRWSSHAIYTGEKTSDWVRLNRVLRTFGPTPRKARTAYIRFMAQSGEEQQSLFRCPVTQDTTAFDSDTGTPVHERRPTNFPRTNTLETIVQKHLKDTLVTDSQLVGPSKQRELSRLRYAIAAEALEVGATTIAEIARRLHRSEAAISQLVSRHSAAGRRKC